MPHAPDALRPLPELLRESVFLAALPGDPREDLGTREVRGAFHSRVRPTRVASPRLVAWASEVADELGVTRPDGDTGPTVDLLGGNLVVEGVAPYAACYGGHQFGSWAGQLGDGRAISLGEVVRGDARFELQLKGAGPTPYSRRGDGRAVLRSSLREFLCSEAMHHLGVPTTRALSLVTTGDAVVRDMFYDGNAREEPGAIVCRVAASFLRFGNFEILTARGDTKNLRALADFTVDTYFPEVARAHAPGEARDGAWFLEVCQRTARMIAQWMRVGFVHGVMNTDNMSILGLTLDYGPYGFLDDFDPTFTPNTTDAAGRRYRFEQQPRIAAWNLARLAQALSPLFETAAPLEAGLAAYADEYGKAYRRVLADKLGLDALLDDDDDTLAGQLFEVLAGAETDFTLFHRGLAALGAEAAAPDVTDEAREAVVAHAFYDPEARSRDSVLALRGWLRRYAARLARSTLPLAARQAAMRAANPALLPRNYLAQLAIDAAEAGDFSKLARLHDAVRRPYDEPAGDADLREKRPAWAKTRAGCGALSCSS